MKFKSLFVLVVIFVLALGACAPAPVEETAAPEAEATEASVDGAALPAACVEDAFWLCRDPRW